MNRGSAPCSTTMLFDGPASMRPRFMNRGSVDPTFLAGRRSRASMRPRFMNRGSLREYYRMMAEGELQ